MRLIDQFRVLGPDGIQHTIARYQDGHNPRRAAGSDAPASVDEFRLNGSQTVARVDNETFVTADGQVLRRAAHR